MSKTLKWGLLSTARINRAMIDPIRRSPRSELVAVASRDIQKAASYAQEWAIPQAYGSYEELLLDPEIDVVYISLPNHLHAEWTIKAARHGKHVLCEKPLVPTMAEFEAVEQAAQENRVTVFEAFMYLHHPQTIEAQKLVRTGMLGRPLWMTSCFSFYLPPEQVQNIRLNPAMAGGCFWDVGVYPNSIAIVMAEAGAPDYVVAHQTLGETGVDVAMIAQLQFANGITAQISSGFRMPFQQGAMIAGEDGILTIASPWKPGSDGKPTELLLASRQGKSTVIPIPVVDPYYCQTQAMENCVLDGAQPLVPLSLSKVFLKSALAIYASAASSEITRI